jgi:hypothetical protein
MTSSTEGGSKTGPLFIEPAVESGPYSLESLIPALPRNYFLIFDVRDIKETNRHYLVHNLRREAVQIYGDGAVQFWDSENSYCARLYSTEAQLERFLHMAKQSMKIWGVRNLGSITKYPASQPQSS